MYISVLLGHFVQMKKYLLVSAVILSVLMSCGNKPVEVTYNGDYCKDHLVKVDTMTLKPGDEGGYVTRKMLTGEHTLTVDSGSPVTFSIDNSGILNIAQEEFIIFPITYTEGGRHEKFAVAGTLLPVMVDSMVVIPDGFRTFMSQNPTRKEIIEASNFQTEAPAFKKFDRKEIYITKTWDLDINAQIPREVKTTAWKSRRSAIAVPQIKMIRKVLEAHTFIRYVEATNLFEMKRLDQFPE